jgi:hypothetical protein
MTPARLQAVEVLGTDPDEGIDYLSDTEYARLSAELAAILEELRRAR